MGNKISPGVPEYPGNARANVPDAPKERHHRDTSGYSRILFECNRFKTTERPHMHTISSVLSIVERGDHTFKTDQQDAYFHVPIHPDGRKYLHFVFENKVHHFRVLPFGLNTAPQVFTRLGHTVAAYLHCQGISVLDDWLIHHRCTQTVKLYLPPVSVTKDTSPGRLQVEQNKI